MSSYYNSTKDGRQQLTVRCTWVSWASSLSTVLEPALINIAVLSRTRAFAHTTQFSHQIHRPIRLSSRADAVRPETDRHIHNLLDSPLLGRFWQMEARVAVH
ncbi:hypothetical protein GGTG_03605 [Gaeumannomyces tritici R3-111a-1]|uniref:Uncharacterized protein n=1 Tax=Gaeumannomyces tritici (strain R3-111a-1) TaxID=644352 RepID=J3NQP9_GAET3|nr:hypothetical protein GGTG_03605 [Gaeumannomyces tritici R3-111a-1]EJT78505.1 hypothetical protein GGTG_03605 [Gaeumannomyces tritici R3-111a-1]